MELVEGLPALWKRHLQPLFNPEVQTPWLGAFEDAYGLHLFSYLSHVRHYVSPVMACAMRGLIAHATLKATISEQWITHFRNIAFTERGHISWLKSIPNPEAFAHAMEALARDMRAHYAQTTWFIVADTGMTSDKYLAFGNMAWDSCVHRPIVPFIHYVFCAMVKRNPILTTGVAETDALMAGAAEEAAFITNVVMPWISAASGQVTAMQPEDDWMRCVAEASAVAVAVAVEVDDDDDEGEDV